MKPSNLMLTRSGRCKVTDFGLARVEEAGDLSGRLPESVGTPLFAAPEVALGHAASAHSDVYSLGATLWYLLTGKPPFHGGSSADIARRHTQEPLPDLTALRPDLPPALVQAVRTALAKEPEDRFESAEQFARVLRLHTIPVESAPSALSVTAPPDAAAAPTTPAAPGSPAPARHRRLWIGAGVAAVALAAGAIAFALAGHGKNAEGKGAGPSNGLVASPPPGGSADSADAPPGAAARPAIPAAATARPQTIDLLHHLDVSRAGVKGNWRFEGGDLVSDSSGPAVLEFPQAVPQEYDFRIEFTPEDCAEQLLYKPDAKSDGKSGGTAFNWCMNVGEICGLESFNHTHVFDPTSPVTRKWHVTPGERHQSLVRVRNGGVQVHLDGQPFLDFPTDYHDLSRVDDWSMRNNTKLGLGSWNKPTRFHKAELIVPPGR